MSCLEKKIGFEYPEAGKTMKLTDLLKKLRAMPLTAGLAEQLEILRARYQAEYENTAEGILRLCETLEIDAVKAGRKYIYDYLKQLDYFIGNKNYGHSDFDEIREEIYDNENVMMETYMPGLLLSYAYTTILYEKNHLFLTRFLPELREDMVGMEVGFGEGFYLWEILRHFSRGKIYGYDISPYARQFAARILAAEGIEKGRYVLKYGNILEGLPKVDGTVDFGVLAEVIEHIPAPELGIHELVRTLRRGGLLYLTTVIDSNHMDHISNFESPAVVEEMLEREGLEITAKKIYRMQDDFPQSKDISVGLAYVARKL